MNSSGLFNADAGAMDKAKEDLERLERIAKSTNKSSFMNLGENKPKLYSESGASYARGNVTDPFRA